MQAEDTVGLAIPLTWLAMLAAEALWPRRRWPALHGYNCADLPLWDMLWGTFRNPARFDGDVGFEGAVLPRLAPLFIGRDANAERYGPANRGRPAAVENPA
jgi:hypothetical protein